MDSIFLSCDCSKGLVVNIKVLLVLLSHILILSRALRGLRYSLGILQELLIFLFQSYSIRKYINCLLSLLFYLIVLSLYFVLKIFLIIAYLCPTIRVSIWTETEFNIQVAHMLLMMELIRLLWWTPSKRELVRFDDIATDFIDVNNVLDLLNQRVVFQFFPLKDWCANNLPLLSLNWCFGPIPTSKD